MSPDDANKPTAPELLAEIMAASLSKNPALAEKQRRLLGLLRSGSTATPPADPTGAPGDPSAPK